MRVKGSWYGRYWSFDWPYEALKERKYLHICNDLWIMSEPNDAAKRIKALEIKNQPFTRSYFNARPHDD